MLTINIFFAIILAMYEEELRVATEAVKKAGKILRDGYYSSHRIEIKDGDWREIVTEMDKAADKAIREIIESAFPKHSINSEESAPKEGDVHTWYIDPLDGTTNYATKVPFFDTAIGLVVGRDPVVSVAFNPVMDELFTAAKSSGASLNGKPIRVSDNNDVRNTMINFCHKNRKESVERIVGLFRQLKEDARDLRQLGAGALDICYVAAGRNDIFFNDSKIWDVATSVVIAKEAGARVTDWQGKEWNADSKNVLVTNQHLHEYMLEKLKGLV